MKDAAHQMAGRDFGIIQVWETVQGSNTAGYNRSGSFYHQHQIFLLVHEKNDSKKWPCHFVISCWINLMGLLYYNRGLERASAHIFGVLLPSLRYKADNGRPML